MCTYIVYVHTCPFGWGEGEGYDGNVRKELNMLNITQYHFTGAFAHWRRAALQYIPCLQYHNNYYAHGLIISQHLSAVPRVIPQHLSAAIGNSSTPAGNTCLHLPLSNIFPIYLLPSARPSVLVTNTLPLPWCTFVANNRGRPFQ